MCSSGDTPFFEYEITDRTVVKLHEEFHFSSSFRPSKRDINGIAIMKDNSPAEDRLRFSFYLNRIAPDNTISFLEFSTSVEVAMLSWKQHIDQTKYEYRRKLDTSADDLSGEKVLTEWKINFESMTNSLNVNTLLALKGAIKIKSTALCDRKGK